MTTPASAIVDRTLSVNWQERSDRRRGMVVLAAVGLGSIGLALLVLALQFVSVVVVVTWIGLFAIAWRPLIGLYVAFGMLMLFEAGGADQLMLPGFYFQGGLGGTVGIPVIASPLELLLILTFVVWLAKLLCSRRLTFETGRLFWPVTLFALALGFGLARGLVTGGDVNIALWESRFLFYAIICYLIATNTIRSRQDIQHIISIGMLAMVLFSIEGAYRRIALIDTGRIGVVPEFAYSHESVIFIGTLLPLIVAQQIFGAPRWQRVLGLASLPIVIYTLLATERRAAYIAVFVAFVAFAVVVFATHRKAFFMLVLPLIIGMSAYVPIFWNNNGLLGQPARAVKSLYQPDPRDAASNLYRDIEKFDIRQTIRANPLFGVGFGQPFYMVIPLPDLSWWPFWHYEPHHNILWIWLKTGTAGFVLFWVLMASSIARSAHLARVLKDPTSRVMAVFALTGIIATLVFCYVDLGLVSGRVTVFLGTLMGVIGVMDRVMAPPPLSAGAS
jgi:hypothetical protein